MPDVSSIGNGPVGPVNRNSAPPSIDENGAVRTAASHPSTRDRVELSDHAQYLDRLRELPDVRTPRVEAVRRAIAEGQYETDDRLNLAIERLLEDLR